MKQHSPDELELIRTALEHLSVVRDANIPSVSEYRLRLACHSLRLLLVDDHLVRAWKASGIGGPIVVEVMCFSHRPGPDDVGFCGGAELIPGVPVSIGWGNVRLALKRLNLHDFVASPCISFKGTLVSRRELISFVANTKGGSHYDPNGRSQKSKSEVFDLLRKLEKDGLAGIGVQLNARNPIHHEVASIIRSLTASKEVVRLLEYAP